MADQKEMAKQLEHASHDSPQSSLQFDQLVVKPWELLIFHEGNEVVRGPLRTSPPTALIG